MKKRERVILRLDAEEHSIDGQILTYIKDDPIVSSRDAVMRALKAFYLLWVLEGRQGEDMRAIAKTTIEELQYRAFQIQQRFLSTEEMNMVLASPSSPNQVVSVEAQSVADSSVAVTVSEMRQQIGSIELEQLLDDF